MKYQLGKRLRYIPKSKLEEVKTVEVVGLRKNGAAKLSNGWLADEDGVVEGSARIPGGRVEEIDN